MTRYPYLLSRLVKCGSCGDCLTGKSAHGNGGKIGYYEHSRATRRQACLVKKVFACEPHRVLAKRLGPLKRKIQDLTTQLEALAARLAELPRGISAQPIYRQMEKIERVREESEEQLRGFESQGALDRGLPPSLEGWFE